MIDFPQVRMQIFTLSFFPQTVNLARPAQHARLKLGTRALALLGMSFADRLRTLRITQEPSWEIEGSQAKAHTRVINGYCSFVKMVSTRLVT